MTPELIYCADGNPVFAKIAIDAGYTYGAQLPNKVYFRPEFVDQNWERPNFGRYMAALKQYRPRLATVLDLEKFSQLARVLFWTVNAAQYLVPEIDEATNQVKEAAVIIIPKAHGAVRFLPRVIHTKNGDIQVRLGYSVQTSFSGTLVGYEEFVGWPVHLLGGRPEKQRRAAAFLNVASVDGNYAGMKARRFCQYFDGKRWLPDGRKTENNAHHATFEKSCIAIKEMWSIAVKPVKLLQTEQSPLW